VQGLCERHQGGLPAHRQAAQPARRRHHFLRRAIPHGHQPADTAATRADAQVWITLEGWDGSLHQASVPLAKASPATVAWLEKQGGKP